MNFGELIREGREWWECLSSEDRYYVIVAALTVGSVLVKMLPDPPPTEQVMRVRIEDLG